MNLGTMQALTTAANPFLRIDGIRPSTWCRNVQRGPRFGPWRHEAVHTVLDASIWDRPGEVIYFVTDSVGRLRLVGESAKRLKDRWRLSPMHDVATRAPMGRWALFHSTAWAAIEHGFDEESPPFTVSALFHDDLLRVLSAADAVRFVSTGPGTLCRRVETAILSSCGSTLKLWNRKGVAKAGETA